MVWFWPKAAKAKAVVWFFDVAWFLVEVPSGRIFSMF